MQKQLAIFCKTANCRQRVVELMTDAGGHLPQYGQFGGLNQLILGDAQHLLGFGALGNFCLQFGSAFHHLKFELLIGLLLQLFYLTVFLLAMVIKLSQQK
ncbi:hypothetical protein BOO35_11130 [Vibrio navarrensis]|nr:hypothetical protein [Vibrio navarrensis]